MPSGRLAFRGCGLGKFDSRAEYKKWYGSAEWRRGRAEHLMREPLCRTCLAKGIVNDGSLTAAGKVQEDPKRRFRVVDHIVPHRGDKSVFLDRSNWQTLCPDHHDITKQREERRGYSNQKGPDGWPIDHHHPANR